MYIEDWDSFYVQAEELWRKEPLKTRYCIKYRHTEGKLVLKVTDDAVVSVFLGAGLKQSAPRSLINFVAGSFVQFAVPQVQDGSAGRRQEDGEAEQPDVPSHVARSGRLPR